MAPTRPPTACARSAPHTVVGMMQVAEISWLSTRLQRRNWIWHLAIQMWYMLPCLPGAPAILCWRAGGLSRILGWAIRAARIRLNHRKCLPDRDRNRDWNDGTQATRKEADGRSGQRNPLAQAP